MLETQLVETVEDTDYILIQAQTDEFSNFAVFVSEESDPEPDSEPTSEPEEAVLPFRVLILIGVGTVAVIDLAVWYTYRQPL